MLHLRFGSFAADASSPPRRSFDKINQYVKQQMPHPFPAAAENGSPEGQVPLALSA